jgi:hypothetical protein
MFTTLRVLHWNIAGAVPHILEESKPNNLGGLQVVNHLLSEAERFQPQLISMNESCLSQAIHAADNLSGPVGTVEMHFGAIAERHPSCISGDDLPPVVVLPPGVPVPVENVGGLVGNAIIAVGADGIWDKRTYYFTDEGRLSDDPTARTAACFLVSFASIGRVVRACSMHLATNEGVASTQLNAFVDFIASEDTKYPLVLIGDFNATPCALSSIYSPKQGGHGRFYEVDAADHAPTFGTRKLDYIFGDADHFTGFVEGQPIDSPICPQLHPLLFQIPPHIVNHPCSDHKMLRGTLSFRNDTAIYREPGAPPLPPPSGTVPDPSPPQIGSPSGEKCGIGAQLLPTGSYRDTCTACTSDDTFLSCSGCLDGNGATHSSGLSLPCSADIANCQGALTCGECERGGPSTEGPVGERQQSKPRPPEEEPVGERQQSKPRATVSDASGTSRASFSGFGAADLVARFSDGFRIWHNLYGDHSGVSPWGSDYSAGSGWSAVDPNRIHFADMNGDGLKDLILLDNDGFRLWQNVQGGSHGEFPWGSDFSAGSGWSTVDGSAIYFADMNGDGRADLIQRAGDTFRIWHNEHGARWGVFPWGEPFDAGSGWGAVDPSDIYFADMNGDGRADLVARWGDTFRIWHNVRGETHGAFPWTEPFDAGSGWGAVDPNSIYFADMNADGRADLVARLGDAFRIWHNVHGETHGAFPWTEPFDAGSGWASVDPSGIYLP